MQNLGRASEELFRRGPDECFATFDALWQHCQEAKADRSSGGIRPSCGSSRTPVRLLGGEEATYRLNDWSFTQLCSLAGVSKDTVNRLSASTASQVFAETLPGGGKPLQLLAVSNGDRRRNRRLRQSGALCLPTCAGPRLRHVEQARRLRAADCVFCPQIAARVKRAAGGQAGRVGDFALYDGQWLAARAG